MRKVLRSLPERVIAVFDVFTPTRVKRERIAALARKLLPVDSGHPLIRLGGANDGGYLIPDDLDGIEYCFSPGVAEQATFELDCLKRGIKSFLADGSVDGPPESLTECEFTKVYLGERNTRTVVTLDKWVRRSLGDGHRGDLILQMDIEGAEFKTLLAASRDTLARFRILVVEFHSAQRMTRYPYYAMWRACIRRLTQLFDVVHVHPNTECGITSVHGFPFPRALEITFLRKDRALKRTPVEKLPHPLDEPTIAAGPDLPLPQAWFEREAQHD